MLENFIKHERIILGFLLKKFHVQLFLHVRKFNVNNYYAKSIKTHCAQSRSGYVTEISIGMSIKVVKNDRRVVSRFTTD